METTDVRSTRNRPPYHVLDVEDDKKGYYHSVLDKFIDEFLIILVPDIDEGSSDNDDDFVGNYSMCLLKYFFVYADLMEKMANFTGKRSLKMANLGLIFLANFAVMRSVLRRFNENRQQFCQFFWKISESLPMP